MDNRNLSIYRNSYDKVGFITTLDAVIERIQSDKNDFVEKTRYCIVLADWVQGVGR